VTLCRWPCSTLAAAAFAVVPAAAGGDDVVPAAIDALLAAPDDPIFFGIPLILPADLQVLSDDRGYVRCLVAVDDVTGDGKSDFAAGHAKGTALDCLVLRDGRDGSIVWSANPTASGFRSLRGLVADGDSLFLGLSSETGRVERRDTADGTLQWARDLATTPGPSQANVSGVSLTSDLNNDGVSDVAVAGGHRIDAALLLSGVDGTTLWSHRAGDVVYDVQEAHDRDGDGLADLAIVGGDDAPFARLLSSADGQVLWDVPLDGPGSVVLPLDDVNGDGTPDLAVGQFNAPGSCLLGLSGVDGTRLWESADVFRNVTDLALIGDLLDTGLSDIVVGSFDNAVSAVLALNGNSEWRREGTTNNGGSMLAVAVTSDLDGNGQRDVLTCSVDHRLYVLGGVAGHWMADYGLETKTSAVLALPDTNGDGRPEIVVGGDDVIAVFDGASGLAEGPVNEFVPAPLGEEGQVIQWAYPATLLWGFVSLAESSLSIPGWDQPFGLDLTSMLVFHKGTAPGAGASVTVLPAFDASHVGLTLYIQSATVQGPGQGLFSDVASLTITP
jgi:hypothetical protein